MMPYYTSDQRNNMIEQKLGHLGMGLFLTTYIIINYIFKCPFLNGEMTSLYSDQNTYFECSGQEQGHPEVIPKYIFTPYQMG